MTWVPYLVTGTLSALTTGFAPRLLGPQVTPTKAYLIQGGIAVAGGIGLPLLGLRPAHGLVWFLVSGGVMLADMVYRFLMPALGLAAYPYQAHAVLSSMGQEPYYPPRLAAYPYGHQPRPALSAYEPAMVTSPVEMPYGRALARRTY